MNYALVFRPEVREEVDEAYSWYESQQLGLGDNFLDCVDEILDRICQMPESYPVVIAMFDERWYVAFPMLCIIALYQAERSRSQFFTVVETLQPCKRESNKLMKQAYPNDVTVLK